MFHVLRQTRFRNAKTILFHRKLEYIPDFPEKTGICSAEAEHREP